MDCNSFSRIQSSSHDSRPSWLDACHRFHFEVRTPGSHELAFNFHRDIVFIPFAHFSSRRRFIERSYIVFALCRHT
jgi:hypothetical protein